MTPSAPAARPTPARARLLAGWSLAVAALAGAVACSALVYLGPSQAGVVTRLGRVVAVDNPNGRAPGFYARWPLLDRVAKLELRAQTLVGAAQAITPADGPPLKAQAALSYRIIDPGAEAKEIGEAPGRLRALLETGLAAALGGAPTQDISAGAPAQLAGALASLREEARRERLGVEVQAITLVGVMPADTDASARRMQAQAQALAASLRAAAEAQARALHAEADRDAAAIRGEGEAQALEVRGAGDAERASILGEAYGCDPEFAHFFRRLDAYDQALDPRTTTLVMPSNSAFLDVFNGGAEAKRRP